MLEDFLDLAVFSLPETQREPGVRALLAVELGLDAEVVDAVDGDAVGETIERRLVDGPMRAHAIAAQPAGRRKLQHAREPAVVGEQQQPFGVDVEPADGDHARQVGRQRRENRLPALRIARGGDEPPGLVEQKEARAFGRGERLAVDAHVVVSLTLKAGLLSTLPLTADPALGDPGLGVAAGTNARPRHDLGDALARADLRAFQLAFRRSWLASFRRRPLTHCRQRPLVLSPNAAGRQRKTLGDSQKTGRTGSADLIEESKSADPMSLAFAEARSAELRGEAPIGAALVREGTVIASAGNRTRELNDPTAHAEMLVIREGASRLGSERLVGCDLYVTLEPCAMCAGAIAFARLRRLYYAAPDPKGGAVDNGPRFFRQPTCHHAPEVYGGLRESEAAEMLRAFFAARR